VRIRGRVISKGFAEGEVIVSRRKFSFLGDVDVESGKVVAEDSDIKGECIANKVFVFPGGRGSTVGTYILLRMKKKGTAPKAIINVETEPIIAVGAIIAGIPLIDKLEVNPLEVLENGDLVVVNAYEGYIEIKGRN
jgi:predicted aconitase with swiveling domain